MAGGLNHSHRDEPGVDAGSGARLDAPFQAGRVGTEPAGEAPPLPLPRRVITHAGADWQRGRFPEATAWTPPAGRRAPRLVGGNPLHAKAAAHSDRRSLRLRSIVPPQSSQDFGGRSVLRERQPFAAVSGSLVFIHAGHHASCLKADVNHPAHLVRIPTAKPTCLRPAAVSQ